MKTGAFKYLVEAVGAEHVALALNINMVRLDELSKGQRFNSETAFHMERTLGLPDGDFDQTNPVLDSAAVARLKASVHDADRDLDFETQGNETTSAVAKALSSSI
ncbi:hypothetical protein [Caballeronia sp. 15715]|uniref:hypothetical protein n=1 Tax=unclassified Caballeronia TaxID=2646786 RepID=UPI0039E68EC3